MSDNPLSIPADEREHFEIWAAGEGLCIRRLDPVVTKNPNLVLQNYANGQTQAAWKSWQIQYIRFNVVALQRAA